METHERERQRLQRDQHAHLPRCRLQHDRGGERQREMAFRLGINLAMYALCLDYKADQVHVPFILKKRRWKVEGASGE